jgi:hypothetical protein
MVLTDERWLLVRKSVNASRNSHQQAALFLAGTTPVNGAGAGGVSRGEAVLSPYRPICPASPTWSMTPRTGKNRYKVTSTKQPGLPAQPGKQQTGRSSPAAAQVEPQRATKPHHQPQTRREDTSFRNAYVAEVAVHDPASARPFPRTGRTARPCAPSLWPGARRQVARAGSRQARRRSPPSGPHPARRRSPPPVPLREEGRPCSSAHRWFRAFRWPSCWLGSLGPGRRDRPPVS